MSLISPIKLKALLAFACFFSFNVLSQDSTKHHLEIGFGAWNTAEIGFRDFTDVYFNLHDKVDSSVHGPMVKFNLTHRFKGIFQSVSFGFRNGRGNYSLYNDVYNETDYWIVHSEETSTVNNLQYSLGYSFFENKKNWVKPNIGLAVDGVKREYLHVVNTRYYSLSEDQEVEERMVITDESEQIVMSLFAGLSYQSNKLRVSFVYNFPVFFSEYGHHDIAEYPTYGGSFDYKRNAKSDGMLRNLNRFGLTMSYRLF